MTRLESQLTFLRELDNLKQVLRQALLVANHRQENTAEHSWHAAMTALTLAEYANEPVDVLRVMKMLLVHDIVEIDAGDTYAFDEVGHLDKEAREQKAATRIFGLLPDDQGADLKALWEEFEYVQSADAKYANAIDQLMPLLHNLWTDGANWQKLQPAYEKVYERNHRRINGGASEVWDYVKQIFDKASANGWLEKSDF